MAVTRTTGGTGNDEDAGNGDVCVYAYVRVCLRVCVRVLVRRHVLRGWSAPQFLASPGRATTTAARTESKHASMATLHTAVCATQE